MNRIFAEQLSANLAAGIKGIYYLAGQDPLLLDESLATIVQNAAAQGFDEKFEMKVEAAADWNGLFDRCQSRGLFFSRQIILLHLPDNIGSALQSSLLQLMQLLNPDILLVLQLSRLSRTTEKQGWHQAALQYEPNLTLVQCQTPNAEQLPRWISHRARQMGLHIEQEAIQLLAYSYENNLLALKQTLQLLMLLYPDKKLSFARVQTIVEQSSLFTPYQWVDALMQGRENRAERILRGLQAEDVQAIILLRALQRELIMLLELAKPQQPIHLDQPLPAAQLKAGFDRLKIWQSRRGLYTELFKRLTYRRLYLIFQRLAELERQAKQSFDTDIWQGLADLSVQICASETKLRN
ncbi:DNA polymerase III delta subunit [Mesocricetibacter intestinalis]|uniref:DNA polymerase III subunit delta n=1 Tax=Mesocricetibacter intestinalis TaxID=1521930 RepID=A0A4R6VCH3_9PAST|nr:DNA polymerase III subunit delta [Mesocricetibacter intestinalis]TDQ58126.1 DNA polymerase III delta subunit [Mesocricetibacter intestinalis]